VECGAQLTDRYYRLQEFFPVASDEGGKHALTSGHWPLATGTRVLPTAILENTIPGVVRVYDTFRDPDTGRAYVAWEEVYGRTLASWLPEEEQTEDGALVELPPTSGKLFNDGVPGEEQSLAWMAQAADVLVALHAQDIVNCNVELTNLVIQPGDRLMLIDLTGCQSIHETDIGTEPLQAKGDDLHRLASELERWYLAVRQDANEQGSQAASPAMPAPAQAADDSNMVAAVDEVTGILTSPTNASIIFAKAREGAYASAEELAQALYDLYDASRPITNIQLWSGRGSDVGQVRQINEDSVLTLEANVLEHDGVLPIGVYVIADGMGGHQSGEVASSIAARTIGAIINNTLVGPLMAGDPVPCDAATCASLMQQAVMEANRRICGLAQERHSDLGTTVTAALVVGNQLTVANVGDSRTYLWRDHELAVITKDHSLVAQLVAAGQITPNEIYTHPRRNEIYRALGDSRLTATEVDTFNYMLRPGDGVLLCSDGLWDFVRDPIINALITNSSDPESACQSLIDQANTAGGEDNISTIFVRIVPPKEDS
jgi:serine/threonine protein phosphatase PrpC